MLDEGSAWDLAPWSLQASSSAAKMGIPGCRVEAGETVVAAGGRGSENGVRGRRRQGLLEDRS